MWETPIHVMDFEGSRRSGIVEYGVVTLQAGGVTETATRLCAPTGTMHIREVQQHGISASEAERAEPFAHEWDYFSKLRTAGPLCAHNAGYEAGLLQAVWPCPRESPDFAHAGNTIADWGPWLDTLQIYRRLYPKLERHNLSELVAVFDLEGSLAEAAKETCPPERRHYHCALYDALASGFLLLRLLQEPALKDLTLPWLFQQSAPSQSAHDAMGQSEFL